MSTLANAPPRGGLSIYAPFLPLLVVCLGPLIFALAKTSALERDMRIAATENMLWVVTQTQMEVLSLTLETGRNPPEPGQIDRQYDLTLSRLNLLLEGPQARYLAQLGHDDPVRGFLDDFLALDPQVQGHDAALHDALHALGERVHPRINRIANDVMTHEWERSATRLDAYRSTQRLVIMAVSFAFLAALAISALLLRNQNRLHRAEVQRLRAATLLERERGTSAMYRDFAAMVSHQMRTPLSLIDSAMHRLARRGEAITAADVAERQGIVRDAVRRLTRLVETVLMLGRLDNDQLQRTLAPVALDALAADVVKRMRSQFPGREIKLSATATGLAALGDPHLVEHILDNLLSNALKYSAPDKSVELRLFPQGGRVACAVTDQGPGIAAEDRARVFDRYYRGRDQRDGQGTGLGLALARELAEAQNGSVTLDSWPGRGSVFTLWLERAQGGAE
ncbi:MAG: Histidine kinase-, DNA gyrase B-, and HSP90-like ATPase [Rhodobacteraceae bacterium HLUCCA12]|nr:MAG: Histidine kinase-, DNA gyrase B-, and HSP90-like ATPase [Rhodobacteraceae bacterium HLUCCA12]